MNKELYKKYCNSNSELNYTEWLEIEVEKSSKKKRKRIKQLTLDGKEIAIYQTITMASAKTGCNRRSISTAALGKINQTGGFRWEYCL